MRIAMLIRPSTRNGASNGTSGPPMHDNGWPPESSGDRDRTTGLRALRAVADRIVLPGAAATMVGLLTGSYEEATLAFLAFLAAGATVRPNPPWLRLTRFAQVPFAAVAPAAALVLLLVTAGVSDLPQLSPLEVALVLLGTTSLGMLTSRLIGTISPVSSPRRVAVIGSARSTLELAHELELAEVVDYVIVGRIDAEIEVDEEDAVVALDDHPRELGRLEQLGSIVEEQGIDLLVMSSDVPRFRVFDEVARTCLHLPVRLVELTGLYEDVFGHVPVAEINAAWFQYIMHPRYSPITPHAKRAFDLVVAIGLGLAFLPILCLCALLIRRDGGPALFRQTRIGEGGRSLVVYKLRTMQVDAGIDSQWASADDPRITRVGAVLRKLHVDELPQLVNVLRGEMSIVGPRPEQPEFVERLETLLPFYSRRHLIKPGMTGWAQIRCGYAGSDVGSAWKLCHDLYYLKYRSMAFDLSILTETLGSVLGAGDHAVNSSSIRFLQTGLGSPLMTTGSSGEAVGKTATGHSPG